MFRKPLAQYYRQIDIKAVRVKNLVSSGYWGYKSIFCPGMGYKIAKQLISPYFPMSSLITLTEYQSYFRKHLHLNYKVSCQIGCFQRCTRMIASCVIPT